MSALTLALLLAAAIVATVAIAHHCHGYAVELVRRLDRDYHGRGCDGPYNCICGGGRP